MATLKRVLNLSDLVLYGIVLVMPIAPIPLFGLVQKLSNGHAITTILLAMFAMLLTAVSYGRMAALYPSAGSAYTYVSRGLAPHLGFLAGWAMILDYLLVPLICTVYGSLTLNRLIPSVPYWMWAALFALFMTSINLLGIRSTARTNLVLTSVMTVVVLAFFGAAIRFIVFSQGIGGLLSATPFYDARTFHLSAIIGGTSLAALTYGGFDGISTLAEEVRNPRRNILLATVAVCLFTGVFGGLQVYLAQLVWPDFSTFRDPDTAFLDVALRAGGAWLFHGIAWILILANVGAGMSAQAGVCRLLYGMGRDQVLPRGLFGHLSNERRVPSYNILLTGAFMFAGALTLNYERAAELINFGAFLAFMGVNASAVRQFYLSPGGSTDRKLWLDLLAPSLGFVFCFAIWLALPSPAKIAGGTWLLLGIIYDGVKSRGFRKAPVAIDLGEA